MQDGIAWAVQGDILLGRLATASVCALGPAIRADLIAHLRAMPAPRALVLTAAAPPARFSLDPAGEAAPTPGDLALALVEAAFPVIVALAGDARGALTELALAGDVILVAHDARLGVPDIAVGLVPGGGATQLLPRRLGARVALDLLLSGRTVGGTEALALGLVDAVVPGDLAEAALARATELAEGPRPPRATPGLDARVYGADIATARGAMLVGGLPAIDRIVEAVEVALILPLAQGLVLESTLRGDLLDSDEVLALQSVEQSARLARRVPRILAGQSARPVTHLYVESVTGGASALAFAALSAGLRVTLAEADREVLTGALKDIARRQDAAVSAGRLDLAARDADWARLATVDPAPLPPEGVDALVFGPDGAPRAAELAQALPPEVPCIVLDAAPGMLSLGLAPSGRVTTLGGLTATPAAASARALLARIGMPAVPAGGEGGSFGIPIAAAGQAALARLLARGVPGDAILAAQVSVQMERPVLPEASPDARANYGQPLIMPRAEILARWWSAMAAAGLDCLASGAALCPADIDHLMVAGHGFPRRLGGPMHLAHRRGLLLLRQDLRLWLRDDRIWAPPPLLDRLITEGRSLASLNPRLSPVSSG